MEPCTLYKKCLWQMCAYSSALAETSCHIFWRQREKGWRWQQIPICLSSQKPPWLRCMRWEDLRISRERLEFRWNTDVKMSLNFWILGSWSWDSNQTTQNAWGKICLLGPLSVLALGTNPRLWGSPAIPWVRPRWHFLTVNFRFLENLATQPQRLTESSKWPEQLYSHL